MDIVSIIVPVYKVEPYLDRCVSSLVNQTWPGLEIILVDDGSPDRCGQMCDAWGERDPRIRVIHKKNGGLSDARNAGLEAVTGAYVIFIDSDDWVTPDFVEVLYTAMTETGAQITECGVIRTYGQEDIPSVEITAPREYNTEEALGQLMRDGDFHQYVWNKLYQRELITALFAVGKTNEDEFWTYQIFGNAKKIVKIQNPMYYYYQRPDSIMGAGYNLRRLHALEAKAQRQEYIDCRFPALSSLARRNFWGSCIYAGQMSLLHLRKAERETARQTIDRLRGQVPLKQEDLQGIGKKEALWLRLGKMSFWGTCRLKNLLKKGI